MNKNAHILLGRLLFIFGFAALVPRWGQAQCSMVSIGGLPYVAPHYLACEGDLPVTLTGNPGFPSGTFSGVGTIGNTFNPIVLSPGDNDFTVTYTIPGVCSESYQIRVTKPQVAQISSPTETLFCEDEPAIPLVGNLGTSGTFLVNGSLASTFDPAVLGVGTHSVEYAYIDPASGCVSLDQMDVAVVALPDVSFSLQTQICVGESPVSLSGNSFTGTFSGAGVVAAGTQTLFDPSIAGVGQHTITHEYTDFAGVCQASASRTITVLEDVVIAFESTAKPCLDDIDTLRFTGSGADANTVFNWEVEGGEIIMDDQAGTIAVRWDFAGEKFVTLDLPGAPCPTTPLTQMYIKDRVTISATDLVETRENEPVQLQAAGQSDLGTTLTYTWLPPGGLSCTDCTTPLALPGSSTIYVVRAAGEFGCAATDTVRVVVLSARDVFVPNAFTPNNDGKNETLLVYGEDIASVRLTIFSRWGEKMFQSDNLNIGWDGTYNGKPANTGVYVYMAEVLFNDGVAEVYKGNVTLLR